MGLILAALAIGGLLILPQAIRLASIEGARIRREKRLQADLDAIRRKYERN